MSTSSKYLLFGVLFGLMFPLIALSVDLLLIQHLPFSFGNIKTVFSNSFLHAIISTAPIFLGSAFFIAGKKAQDLEVSNQVLQEINVRLSSNVQALDNFNYEITHELKTAIIEAKSLSLLIEKHIENKDKRAHLLNLLRSSSDKGVETIDTFVKKLDAVRNELKTSNNNSISNLD